MQGDKEFKVVMQGDMEKAKGGEDKGQGVQGEDGGQGQSSSAQSSDSLERAATHSET